MKFKLFFIFVLFLVSINIVNALANCSEMTYQPVQYWDFEEGTGTNAIDSGSSAHNGTIVNGKYTNAQKKIGNYAIAFSNTGGINLGRWDFSCNNSKEFTFLAWVYNNNSASYGAADFVISKDASLGLRLKNTEGFYGQFATPWITTLNAPDSTFPVNQWVLIGMRYSGTVLSLIANGAIVANVSDTDNLACNTAKDQWLGRYGDGDSNNWEGYYDDAALWGSSLPDSYITQLYNGSNGMPFCYINTTTIINNFPSVTNLTQYPSNATLINILQGINISADINDTDLNLSSIYLDLKLNKSFTTVNGTLINQNTTNKYNTSIGNTYYWLGYDETELFSGTYNINPNIMEGTDHLNLTLSTSSDYIKMEFLNITPNVNFSFYEIMSENASSVVSLSNYYYCNSSYVSGNPIISPYCALFASETNNKSFSHIHTTGKSKHKVYSLNVVNSQIEGIGVTERSYILKQGSSSGDLVYYIPIQTRQNTTQYTSNNGATWVSRNYTIDSHIHQIRPNEVFYYRVCASDNASQQTCSSYNSDFIDVPNLPPSQLIFYSPINKTYNTSLLINHSIATSATGLNITRYVYYYSTDHFNLNSITEQNNNTPFTWDISAISDGYYYVDVLIYDILNQTTLSSSQRFLINNTIPPTEEVKALNNIANNIYTLSEVLNMIGYIFLFIVNLIILFLLINNRLDNLYSFFNGIFSLVLVVLFWTNMQIIAYLELIVLVFNMMLFFKPADSVGKTW